MKILISQNINIFTEQVLDRAHPNIQQVAWLEVATTGFQALSLDQLTVRTKVYEYALLPHRQKYMVLFRVHLM